MQQMPKSSYGIVVSLVALAVLFCLGGCGSKEPMPLTEHNLIRWGDLCKAKEAQLAASADTTPQTDEERVERFKLLFAEPVEELGYSFDATLRAVLRISATSGDVNASALANAMAPPSILLREPLLQEGVITAETKKLLDELAPAYGLDINNQFVQAVLGGDFTQAEEALDKGADVNTKASSGETALHKSLANEQAVRFLLDKGADPNAVDAAGASPLHYALNMPELPLAGLSLLLEHGANPNATNGDNATVLHAALRREDLNLDVVKQLLQAGANPNAYDNRGLTPLHVALTLDTLNLDLLHMLIDSDADVNAEAKTEGDPEKPVVLAAARPYSVEWEAAIRALADAGAPVANGPVLAYCLVRLCDTRELNGSGVDDPPCAQSLAFLQYLIERQGDINFVVGDNQPCLSYLIKKNWADPFVRGAIALLASHGAKSAEGSTVYHETLGDALLQTESLDVALSMLDLFRESGYDINAKNSDGDSVLFWWIRGGSNFTEEAYFAVLRYLIDHGSDISAACTDGQGRTVLERAQENSFAVEFFRNLDPKLTQGSFRDDKNSVDWLLVKNGIEVSDGESPFHAILGRSIQDEVDFQTRTDLITQCIAAGYDINAKNRDGDAVVNVWLQRGLGLATDDQQYKDMIKFLLTHGVDLSPSNRDSFGRTVLEDVARITLAQEAVDELKKAGQLKDAAPAATSASDTPKDVSPSVDTPTASTAGNELPGPESAFLRYRGTLNGKIEYFMTLEKSGSEVKGVYFYTKRRVEIPVKGGISHDNEFSLLEEGEPSTITGTFKGTGLGLDHVVGQWSNAEGTRNYAFEMEAVDAAAVDAARAGKTE